MQLSPEQTAKLARLWQWREGQQFVTHGGRGHRFRTDMDGRPNNCRVRSEVIGDPGVLVPYLNDDATADGLPRSVRAAWGDESLHVRPLETNVHDGKGGTMPATWWAIWRLDGPLMVQERTFLAGPTHEDAWIAAILAAPEGK